MSIALPAGTVTKDSHDDLWRTFCCNRPDDEKVPPVDWSDYFNAFVFCFLPPQDKIDQMDARQIKEMCLREARFMRSFGLWCHNRRFYRSEQGRFGWVPDQTRPGDTLCILNGLSVPLVLRPTESGYFEVVGDGYVQGMMDGGAMDMDLEEEDIHIV
jgi:hypothetical protein